MKPFRAILHTILALTCLGLSAQDSARVKGRWSIGVGGSIDRAFRTIEKGDDDLPLDDILAWREEHESVRIGFALDLYACRDLGSKWSIVAGFQFSDRGFRSEHEIELIATDGVENDPILHGTSIRYEESFHYRYTSFPILARFKLGKGRLRFEPSMGVQADWLLDQFSTLQVDYPDGYSYIRKVSNGHTDLTDFGWSSIVELSMHLSLNDAWGIRLAPRARYQITPIADSPIIGHLYEIGMFLGATYRF